MYEGTFRLAAALTVALIERETAQLMADVESATLVESSRDCVLAMVRAAVAHQMSEA